MAVARFLQVSDLHLGRPFGWLPAERRAERRSDQRRALERAVREAMERGAHAILVPGDLFDQEGVDAEMLAFALHAFDLAGCPPVFIAPGNHDPYSPTSVTWNRRLLEARGLAWPAHVHVFDTPHWSSVALQTAPGVRVWGRCFTANVESTDRPLAPEAFGEVDSAGASGFDVALFHGSREGVCPPGQAVTAPFSDDEVTAAPFAYMAAGHYHVPSRIEATDGVSAATGVRLAYAGSVTALDLTEVGAHGGREVRIEYGSRKPSVEVEAVELDRRRVYHLAADVTGCASAEQVDRRVLKALDDSGATEMDIAFVRLSGRLVKGVRYAGPGADLKARAFHVRTDLRGVRPDHDLEGYRAGSGATTEEGFARALIERLDAATDDEERALVLRALYYGLDAFTLREVVPAYEELER
jgi:DNA repair protein SbcD/Mre11